MKLKYNDAQHAYWIDGKRCRSVTALAKIPDDQFHLNLWKQRQVAIGLARSPHLLESVAAHHTDKKKVDALCEQAMEAAGAGVAAEWGTAAHRVTERHDGDEELIETARTATIRKTWQDALDVAKLTIVSDLCERVVVYPDRLVAGKFDRILRREDGSLVMADLKTGTNATSYPHAISVQMALYVNAPWMAWAFDGLEGETENFDKLPDELDRTKGLIIHMPEPDSATIYEINLVAGWKVATGVIFPTLEWRNRTGLVRRLPV